MSIYEFILSVSKIHILCPVSAWPFKIPYFFHKRALPGCLVLCDLHLNSVSPLSRGFKAILMLFLHVGPLDAFKSGILKNLNGNYNYRGDWHWLLIL